MKLSIILTISMFVILIVSTVQAKYVFQYEFYIANLNIDRTRPKIELVEVTNSNASHEYQANKTDSIIIKIKVTDKNLKDVFLNGEYLNVTINDENVDYACIKVDKIEDITDGGIYQIELTNLEGNGVLKVDILEGAAVDTGELKSEKFEIFTGVLIDNNVNIDDNNINNNNGDINDINFMTFTYE